MYHYRSIRQNRRNHVKVTSPEEDRTIKRDQEKMHQFRGHLFASFSKQNEHPSLMPIGLLSFLMGYNNKCALQEIDEHNRCNFRKTIDFITSPSVFRPHVTNLQ